MELVSDCSYEKLIACIIFERNLIYASPLEFITRDFVAIQVSLEAVKKNWKDSCVFRILR